PAQRAAELDAAAGDAVDARLRRGLRSLLVPVHRRRRLDDRGRHRRRPAARPAPPPRRPRRLVADAAGGGRDPDLEPVAGARAASLTLACGLLAAASLAGCALVPGASSQRGVSERVRIVHGSNGSSTVLLPVTIQGQGPYEFALDTGASKSLVAASIAS